MTLIIQADPKPVALPQIVFDEEKHAYTIDGLPALSVTQMMKICGLVDFSHIPKLKLQRAMDFGTAVHKACELYLQKDLNEQKLDKALSPYLDGFKLFMEHTKFKPLFIEQIIGLKLLQIAGRPDIVGLYEDKVILIDIKTPVEIRASAEIQTAGYRYIWNHPSNEVLGYPKIQERYILRLREDGKYRFDRCKNPTDEQLFVACYSLCSWKKQHNLLLWGNNA